jgi:hypothetical protein
METMSDTNEERLLIDLLRDLGEADAQLLPSADLEQRALSRWDRSREMITHRSGRTFVVIAMAAIVLLAIAGSIRFEHAANRQPTIAASTELPAQTIVATAPRDLSKPPALATTTLPAAATRTSRTTTHARVRRPPAEREVVEFVPLVPMTEAELSGSFQIVRVQMPRAALGGWPDNLTLRHADDPIQADLLLGEDGLARAIRVSSDGAAPWRSR